MKVYFENIPAMRFLCFFSTFLFVTYKDPGPLVQDEYIYGALHRLFIHGNMGVDFFLVLCGFLISYLLEVEKDNYGKIDWKKYLYRRILKIWPLFFLSVLIGFTLYPLFKELLGQPDRNNAHFIYYLFFVNNFDFLKAGYPYTSILAGMWTTAVQEQFYVIWLIFSILLSRRYLIWTAIALIGISFVFRYGHPTRIYHDLHSIAAMNNFMIGSLGAYVALDKRYLEKIIHWPKWFIVAIYIGFFTVYLFRRYLFFNFTMLPFDKIAVAVPIILIILEQNFSRNSLFKLSSFKWMTALGNISYGLYCYHFIAIYAVELLYVHYLEQFGFILTRILIIPLLAFVISYGLAKLSFRYFETPFLKLKLKQSIIQTSDKKSLP